MLIPDRGRFVGAIALRSGEAALAAKAIGMPNRKTWDSRSNVVARGLKLTGCGNADQGNTTRRMNRNTPTPNSPPKMKGRRTNSEGAAAGQNESAGEGHGHREVENEPEGRGGAAAGVGVPPQEAAGYRLQQTHCGYAVIGRERDGEKNIERTAHEAADQDCPPARTLRH